MMQYDSHNVFAKIIEGKLQCDKVYEDDVAIAFNDLYPAAPLHILVIPKKQYVSYEDFISTASEAEIVSFFKAIQNVTKKFSLEESGYRLITNHGKDAMQTVGHFHVHILGKTKLGALVVGDNHHIQ